MSGEARTKGLVAPQQSPETRGAASATTCAQASYHPHSPCPKLRGTRDLHSCTELVAFDASADGHLPRAPVTLESHGLEVQMRLEGRSRSTLHASAAPFLAGMNLAPGGPGPARRETLQGLGYPPRQG